MSTCAFGASCYFKTPLPLHTAPTQCGAATTLATQFATSCTVACTLGYQPNVTSVPCATAAQLTPSWGCVPACRFHTPLPRNSLTSASTCGSYTTATTSVFTSSCNVGCAGGFAPHPATVSCPVSGLRLTPQWNCVPTCYFKNPLPPNTLYSASYCGFHNASTSTFEVSCTVGCMTGYISRPLAVGCHSPGQIIPSWKCLPTCYFSNPLPANSISVPTHCGGHNSSTSPFAVSCRVGCAAGYRPDQDHAVISCPAPGQLTPTWKCVPTCYFRTPLPLHSIISGSRCGFFTSPTRAFEGSCDAGCAPGYKPNVTKFYCNAPAQFTPAWRCDRKRFAFSLSALLDVEFAELGRGSALVVFLSVFVLGGVFLFVLSRFRGRQNAPLLESEMNSL